MISKPDHTGYDTVTSHNFLPPLTHHTTPRTDDPSRDLHPAHASTPLQPPSKMPSARALLAGAAAASVAASAASAASVSAGVVQRVESLGDGPFPTPDPFLFCVSSPHQHHGYRLP
jgi:hypothetical protein